MSTEENQQVLKNHPIPQEAFDWYDEYAHGLIDRRTFMERLATISPCAYSSYQSKAS
jgi:carboxymethylenebutenolidase